MSRHAVRSSIPLIHEATSDENLPESLKPRQSADGELLTYRDRNHVARSLFSCCSKSSRDSADEGFVYISVVRQRPCRPTLLFDPAGQLCYYWSGVVSVAFLYNLWVISYRIGFDEIRADTKYTWFALDYSADFIYILDLLMGFRTCYFTDGVLQTNAIKIRQNYMNSLHFYLGCLSLLPLDVLYLSFGYLSVVRCIRLVKIYKFWAFIDISERHTSYPNSFRVLVLIHYLLLVFHWNACILYSYRDLFTIVSLNENGTLTTADSWDHDSDKLHNYVTAYSLSCSVLLLVSGHTALRPHRRKSAQLFMVVEQITGLLMLALVLGYVANLVSQLSNARRQFQKNLDVVKTYMRLRRVPAYLQMKVIRWFDYLWHTQRLGDESEALNCLPDRLKGEIAIQVHLNTLKRVEIFRNTEPGFLCELVLRLEPLLFSPGDYVCRKGEVGKEMYIVNGGKLRVINDELGTVLATLTAGAYFGEISLLNVGSEGNRRTASVLSVGYSELLCLSKKDIWEVLEDYPTARERLEEIARKRLEEVRKQKANSTDTNKTADSNDRVGSIDSMTRRASAPALALRSTRILSIPKPSPGSIRRNLPFVQESASGEADGDEVDVSKSSSCEYIDEGGRI